MEEKIYRVFGELTVPVYLSVRASDKPNAYKVASRTLNTNNIELIEGDIYTSDNKQHVLLASYSCVRWIEVLNKEDI